MPTKVDIPEPECHLGYTEAQVEEILGSRLAEFRKFMVGQTGAICDGRRYDHDKQEYEPTECGPHGPVYYRVDLDHFLRGLPAFDDPASDPWNP